MGNSQSAACCLLRRGGDDAADEYLQPRADRNGSRDSYYSIPEAEEIWRLIDEQDLAAGDEAADDDAEFGEDAADAEQPAQHRRSSWTRLKNGRRPLTLVPEEALADFTGSQAAGHAGAEDTTPALRKLNDEEECFMPRVPRVRERVRAKWAERRRRAAPEELDAELLRLLEEGFPELDEWTNMETCLRMLSAMQGQEEAASELLVKAIECRVRDRELYATLHCEVRCDIRVIGRDLEQRPTVYLCCRNQAGPLREVVPQIQLAFEAAVRLGQHQGGGQFVFIADMHRLSVSLNMDPYALKALASTLGSVFADRFACILLVDFSMVAQGLWSLAKPLLSEKTQKKINFVGVKQAREIVKERFASSACDRILSSFEINRDRGAADREREAHARHTTICDVPLGAVRPTDIAG